MSKEILLRVENLKKYFELKSGMFGKSEYLRAVDDVSFELPHGHAVSLVGESGSGKTTLGKTILRLYKPTGGKIYFEGTDITDLGGKDLMWYRRETGLVQQDPFGALPSFMTVQGILEEPLKIHGVKNPTEREERVHRALEEVRMTPVHDFMGKYPHMLSGGQQQRVVIARAIILNPKLIIADEPVSMLDASVRVEILTLLEELQKRHDLSVIYITHDLSTTRYFSEWIYIMYAGKIVEKARTKQLLREHRHPYSKALLKAIPDPDAENRFKMRDVPSGEVPKLVGPPVPCAFRSKCAMYKKGVCKEEEPPDVEVAEEHWVKCWLYV